MFRTSSAFTLPFSRLARRSLMLWPARSLIAFSATFCTEGFARSSFPLRTLRLLPAGATVAGWDSLLPLEGRALFTAHAKPRLMTLLAAGHETTATALTWALYWIHKLPGVRDRLLEDFGPLDPSDHGGLSRLPYLNAVCSETLRIYPVGMLTFPRVTTSTVEVTGYSLEPGTVVVGSIYLTHRREEIYPNPDEFRPERFLERRFSSFEYLPFGGGTRRCIGMAFAQFEMKLVIKRILSSFELALNNGRFVRPVRRGLTAGPSPFKMVVRNKMSNPYR